jgi:hypothetical protein
VSLFLPCATQFTNLEIQKILKQAQESSFSSDKINYINIKIEENLILKSELDALKQSNSDPNRVTYLSNYLRRQLFELLEETKPLKKTNDGTATIRAIERAKIRASEKSRLLKLEKEKEMNEHFIMNERRLEIVDKSIIDLRSRGVNLGLNSKGYIHYTYIHTYIRDTYLHKLEIISIM